jgi:hypothetical protein
MTALCADIPPDFVAAITEGDSAHARLLTLISRMNTTEKLESDQVPLVKFLNKAIVMAAGRPGERVFRQALVEVEQVRRRQAGGRLQEPGGRTWQPPSEHPEYSSAVSSAHAWLPVRFLADGQRAGESVALVSVVRFEQGEMKTAWPRTAGTGWLIGPDLLITAYHVVNARLDGEEAADEEDFTAQALSVQAIFGYDREDRPGTSVGVTGLVERNRELGYVLLRLKSAPGLSPLQLAASAPAADVPAGEDSHPPLNVILHRRDQPKLLIVRNCLATTVTERENDVGYFSDSDLGASGAPVFDDEWRVVAMHRATAQVRGVMFQGLTTAWANVATQLTAILADLERRSGEARRAIADAQAELSRPRLTLVRSVGGPDAVCLFESGDELNGMILSIATGYQAGKGRWLWDHDSLLGKVDEVSRQFDAIDDWLAAAELSASGLRDALDGHDAVTDRFRQRLGALDSQETPAAQRSLRSWEFEQAGAALLELIARVQKQLRLLGPGVHPPGPS